MGHAPPPRTAIVVLGMHRSGSSALTRTLSLLGAGLPEHLIAANANNEAGYWEPERLVDLNALLLAHAGSRWDDWCAFDETVLSPEGVAHFKNEISRIIDEDFGNAPLIVLKDPRICRLVPFYETVFEDIGITPRYVLLQRNPLAIIASLERRNGMTAAYASLLWLRHVLDSEAHTRGRKRAFVSYEALMDDWRETKKKIDRRLGIDWPRDDQEAAAEIDSHLDRKLQHHSSSLEDLNGGSNVLKWVRDAYGACTELIDDPHTEAPMSRLSAIADQFNAMSQVFGQAVFPRFRMLEKRAFEQTKTAERHERDARELKELCAQKDKLLDEKTSALNETTTALDEKTAALDHAMKELDGKTEALNSITEALDLKTEEVRGKDEALDERQKEIDALRRSTSWKVTAPLRALRRVFG